MELTGAQALIKSLEMCDVEVMFGLPGGAILPVYDPILDSKIRHVLVRHEQGAGHMAQGYAHVTGKPGVAIVTSGPAATNIVTPLATRTWTQYLWSQLQAKLRLDQLVPMPSKNVTQRESRWPLLNTITW